MLLYPDSKLYIICAGGVRNDAAELCHRLCSRLVRLGVNAFLVYIPVADNFNPDEPIPPAYKYFRVPYIYDVEDDSKNVVIVPETMTTFLYAFKNIRRVIWWLSVDNFFRDTALKTVAQFDKILTAPMPKFFCFQKFDDDIEHWTQSEYAKQFLKVNAVPDERIYPIGDYVSPTLMKLHDSVDFSKKKNTVVFNAASDSKFISKLASMVPKANWLAIQDSQAEDAPKLLAEAKIYVDFSDHVSKDMMPRRAAILGCVVITGRRGAAANDVDINIPADFKFGETEDDMPKIADKVKEILADFQDAYDSQKDFLDKILNEQEIFNRNVARTLGIKKRADSEPAAIFDGLNETGATVAEIMLQNEVGLEIAFIVNDNPENEKNSALNITYEKNNVSLTLTNGELLPIINSDEARFLYNEGRIKKFILLTFDKTDENIVKAKINPLDEDIISTECQ